MELRDNPLLEEFRTIGHYSYEKIVNFLQFMQIINTRVQFTYFNFKINRNRSDHWPPVAEF